MTLSIWRFAHLALAFVSTLFLIILSVTGVILAFDAVNEKMPDYRVENIGSVSLAECIPALSKIYPEIIALSVDHNQFVTIDATNQDGDPVKAYIDPTNGKILGPIIPKSEFIQWNISLHRSLFLKETGRIAVGVVSFLLFLITISGVILIVKRQQGLRHFFAKINRDFFSQYFHVVSGRIFLIPILVISLTGTYLFMVRIGIMNETEQERVTAPQSEEPVPMEKSRFPVFIQTKLADVEKIEFPLFEGDPEEFYTLNLKDKTIIINQIDGSIAAQHPHTQTVIFEKLSLDLHTGRTNILWAILLGFASLNILAFIYTGFVMTFKRTRTKIRNRFNAENAEIVVLVGTENGSTLFYANQVHQQLLAGEKRSFISEMNQYRSFPQAKHLLVFTSTYGLGSPPANATRFTDLVHEVAQQQDISFSVVGFGSKAYPDFCKYAFEVNQLVAHQSWATPLVDIHTVNDKSPEEFALWAEAWSQQADVPLSLESTVIPQKNKLRKLTVTMNSGTSEPDGTFLVRLRAGVGQSVTSGDLLAIYPENDHRERLYSIGVVDKELQLSIRLHPGGIGSTFLHELTTGQTIRARIVRNAHFHFPASATQVVMIANGTGIAPFLGMLSQNRNKKPCHLYCGFRDPSSISIYQDFIEKQKTGNRLQTLSIAFSRQGPKQYVGDLLVRDAEKIAGILSDNGVLMLCGSLSMQKTVLDQLEKICVSHLNKTLSHFQSHGQILMDCY